LAGTRTIGVAELVEIACSSEIASA